MAGDFPLKHPDKAAGNRLSALSAGKALAGCGSPTSTEKRAHNCPVLHLLGCRRPLAPGQFTTSPTESPLWWFPASKSNLAREPFSMFPRQNNRTRHMSV